MAYEFPPKTLRVRRELASAIVWTLKLDFDGVIRDRGNATAVLDERLQARGIHRERHHIASMLKALATSEWGDLIELKVNGRRTQRIMLNHESPHYLPPNPFPPEPEPEPKPVVATPEAVAVAPQEPAAAPAASNGHEPLVGTPAAITRPPTDAELEAFVNGKASELEPIDLTVMEPDFEPFTIPEELRDSSSVIDKLFVALGVINEAVIQTASQPTPTSDQGTAERLAKVLEENQTLRRQRDSYKETVVAQKGHIEGLQKANIQIKSNYDAVVAAAQGARGPDARDQLARFAQERPKVRGHY